MLAIERLIADVIILNEDPSSYLDEIHAQLTALLDDGPWRTWKHRSGGAYLLRGDLTGKLERTLIEVVARAVLGGNRGDLRAQLDKPYPVQIHSRPVFARAPSSVSAVAPMVDPPIAPPVMMLANGLGGFTDEPSPAIVLRATGTPLPWANAVANEHF
jgi:cyclic beta-1,2-glucan synthetase